MAASSGPSEILICSQINLFLTISNTPPHLLVQSFLNLLYPYGKNSLLLIPWGKWLSEPIIMSVSLSRKNVSTSSFLFQRLRKLAVNMCKLFTLQRTGYWVMEETEEIDEFVVSNNLLATLRRPELQHNYSIELLSWYASNIIVFMFIQDLWNHWSQLLHAIEGPIHCFMTFPTRKLWCSRAWIYFYGATEYQ